MRRPIRPEFPLLSPASEERIRDHLAAIVKIPRRLQNSATRQAGHAIASAVKRVAPILAALIFATFFVSIIVIANSGDGPNWWPFIERLPMGDKIGHLGLVGALSLLFNFAFRLRQPGWLPSVVTPVSFILLVLLTSEELSQAFIPSRTCDPFDWLADLLGIACGQWFATRLGKSRNLATGD